MKQNTKKIVLTGMLLAIGVVLPSITMRIAGIGRMLLPMHIPVLLCGFLCGAPYGALIGVLLPLINSMLFQAPPFMPVAIAMSMELLTYGVFTGVLHKLFKNIKFGIYLTLIPSMIIGRLVWGVITYLLYYILGNGFTLQLFYTQAVINGIPGIMIQLLLIPMILYGVKKVSKDNLAYE